MSVHEIERGIKLRAVSLTKATAGRGEGGISSQLAFP